MKPNIPWDAKIDYSKSMLKDMPQGFITVPQGATNGDIIEAITNRKPMIDAFGSPYMVFSEKWWNTPYKISEVENGNV